MNIRYPIYEGVYRILTVNIGEELYLRPEDGCLLAGEIRF